VSENEKHGAESGNVETVEVSPGTGEEPTIADVSGDLIATMMLESPTEPVSTQPFAEDGEPATPTEVVPTQALAEEDELESPTEPVSTQPFADEDEPATPTEVVPTQALAEDDELESPTEPVSTQPLAEDGEPATPTKVMSADGASGEYRRIGTGVPGAGAGGTSVSQISPATAAAWHGGPPKKPRRALLRGWLLPLLVLIGVIVLLLWQHVGGRLSVSGAAVAARTSLIGCDTTEIVTATLHTNGKPGTIEYRWVRSDGTASDELQQRVSAGTTQVDVVLRWAFSGHGSMHALATIDVQSPGSASAVATFDYVCP
jgi:hypothetical protein